MIVYRRQEKENALHNGNSVRYSPLTSFVRFTQWFRGILNFCQELYTVHTQHNFLSAVCSNSLIVSCHLGFVFRGTEQSDVWPIAELCHHGSPCHKHNSSSPLTQPCLAQLLYKIWTYFSSQQRASTVTRLLTARCCWAVILVVSTSSLCSPLTQQRRKMERGCYRLHHKLNHELNARTQAARQSWFVCLSTYTTSACESILGPQCRGMFVSKIPITPSGIEPATFQPVVQCLKQTAPPREGCVCFSFYHQ